MNSKVNVVILLGAFNAEKYIKEQIDSILDQTYENWHLYLRDDSSSDSTLSILREYSNQYSNIHLIEDSLGNLGCNGNYFHLLNLIEGEYYMFCNADDFWISNKVELSVAKMKEVEAKYNDKNLPIIVHTDLAITDSELRIIYSSMWNYDQLDPKDMYSYNYTGICNTIAGATMLFNHAVKKITFPVSPFAPFFDHWMALQVLNSKGVIVPIYCSTVLYRQIGSNLAAINLKEENTLIYKFRNLKKTLNVNIKEAKMLKKIGWGGFLKYTLIKCEIFLKLRCFGKKF